jgi:hypothetical protein
MHLVGPLRLEALASLLVLRRLAVADHAAVNDWSILRPQVTKLKIELLVGTMEPCCRPLPTVSPSGRCRSNDIRGCCGRWFQPPTCPTLAGACRATSSLLYAAKGQMSHRGTMSTRKRLGKRKHHGRNSCLCRHSESTEGSSGTPVPGMKAVRGKVGFTVGAPVRLWRSVVGGGVKKTYTQPPSSWVNIGNRAVTKYELLLL